MEQESAPNNFQIVLTTVGKLSESSSEDCFTFENEPYMKLLVWDDFSTLLSKKLKFRLFCCFNSNKILGIKKHTGFSLEKRIINNHQYVVLLYSSASFKITSSYGMKERNEKSFLVHSFFETTRAENQDTGSRKMSLESFYERLRLAHENDDLSNVPQDVQHKSLRPILRPYQVCDFLVEHPFKF